MKTLWVARLAGLISAVALVQVAVAGPGPATAASSPGVPNAATEKELLAELADAPQPNPRRADRLIELLEQAGLQDIRTQPVKGFEGRYNIVATLPGDSRETIIVGAHFDCDPRGRGVIDNWSGATMMANLAQSLRASRRKRTFVFVGFDLEEKGMVGSRQYVAMLTQEQKDRIRAMVNLDSLGVSFAKVWLTGSADDLVDLAVQVARQTSIKVETRQLRGFLADSSSFMAAGIPAIMFDSLERQDFRLINSPGDRYEAIRPEMFVQQHRYLLAFLTALDAHEGKISAARKAQAAGEADASKEQMTQSAGGGAQTQPASRPALPKDLPKELVLDLGGGASMKMVLVPAGRFLMGSVYTEPGRKPDETRHEVTISRPFYMGIHEVTRSQFAAFVKDSGYVTRAEQTGFSRVRGPSGWQSARGVSWRNPGFDQTDRHPVVCVSWNDATAFCKWLSGKTGKPVGLPTEAEWEYACRAGAATAYQWGDYSAGGKGWLNAADLTGRKSFPNWTGSFPFEDGFTYTAPVGSFKPNAFGLYDMQGNVCEWVQDLYGPYPAGAVKDPSGPASGAARVLRRGAWVDGAAGSRIAFRESARPDTNLGSLGFRVAAGGAASP